MKQYEALHLSAGRDYRSSSRYEYVLFSGEAGEDGEIVKREGGFKSKAAAVRAGRKAAEPLLAEALFGEKA